MFVLIVFLVLPGTGATIYNATWASIDSRPLPEWFDEAKFGIMNHWGVYSVHGLSCWFDYNWKILKRQEEIEYMKNNFRPNFTYADFGPQFKAEFFDPVKFADIVKRSGAKYYVLTSKYVDGYTMYPSKYAWNWNSVDVGPNRDFAHELRSELGKLGGVHFGLLFSLTDMNKLYLQDRNNSFKTNDFVKMVSQPQLREIVTMYEPDIIYTVDGNSEASSDYWNSTQFLAWLYNTSPVKDKVVVNDNWGKGTHWAHGGFYSLVTATPSSLYNIRKWATSVSLQWSWTWDPAKGARNVKSTATMLRILANTVSCGGNLFLNFGPTGYGTIPSIIEERLTQIGKWLETNGEAIYATKPWIYQNDTAEKTVWYTSKVRSDHGLAVGRIFNPQTEKNTIVYAIVTQLPEDGIVKLKNVETTKQTKMSLLGYDGPVTFKPRGGLVEIFLNNIPWRKLPSLDAWVIKMEYLQDDHHTPLIIETEEQKFENYDQF